MGKVGIVIEAILKTEPRGGISSISKEWGMPRTTPNVAERWHETEQEERLHSSSQLPRAEYPGAIRLVSSSNSASILLFELVPRIVWFTRNLSLCNYKPFQTWALFLDLALPSNGWCDYMAYTSYSNSAYWTQSGWVLGRSSDWKSTSLIGLDELFS